MIDAMKSLIIISLLSFLLTGSLAESQAHYYSNEAPVDDIPFNTAAVASTTGDHDLFVKLWGLEEEAPACDIPFNCEKIASDTRVDRIVENNNEEAVDDIPFNTSEIFTLAMADRLREDMTNEEAAEDIPFNTEMIASNTLFENEVTEDYIAERSVEDLPFNTMDEFLEVAFCDFFQEEPVCDFPFNTETIYCSNITCQKERNILRLTAEIANTTRVYEIEIPEYLPNITSDDVFQSIIMSETRNWSERKESGY